MVITDILGKVITSSQGIGKISEIDLSNYNNGRGNHFRKKTDAAEIDKASLVSIEVVENKRFTMV